jgi:ribosomal protein S18 acetylase RimI-like enzyme
VSPASRGKGTGRRLAEAAVARARAMGAERVELFSNTVLEPAISLYRSLGFVEVSLDNAEHMRSNIRMVLRLKPTDGWKDEEG